MGGFVMDLVQESPNLVLCDGIWVRKVKIWGFCDGFGSGKFEFGSLWWDLGQKSSNLALWDEIWVIKV